MYDGYASKYGAEAYRYISELLQEAKKYHQEDYVRKNPDGDAEQSWRAFKGKNLEKLVFHIIKKSIEEIGLKIINGNEITGSALDEKLSKVKRNVLIDYGEYGCHLPDIDLLVYNPNTLNVVAIMSSKVTLRERIAQTGYWKYKIKENPVTANIKVLFITLDEDSTLTSKSPAKKGRAIAEKDTDGTYVLTERNLEVSNNVKMFESLIDDIERYVLPRKIH